MIKFIHGSEDSTDIDVLYVFDKLPETIQECKDFCSADPSENRNIIVIKDGIVVDCLKGTPDEVNNSLLRTYSLHEQQYPLPITREVKRDVTIKVIRAIRIILSHLSRSQERKKVKHALANGFKERIEILKNLGLSTIDYKMLEPKTNREEVLKTIAFQLGQTMALIYGIELYTKSEVAHCYPFLKQYLYRQKNSHLKEIEEFKKRFIESIEKIIKYDGDGIEITYVPTGTKYNVKSEQKI